MKENETKAFYMPLGYVSVSGGGLDGISGVKGMVVYYLAQLQRTHKRFTGLSRTSARQYKGGN